MNDKLRDEIPKTGDASHLLDNEPEPVQTVEPQQVDVSVRGGDGISRGVVKEDGRQASLPGRVISVITAQQQIDTVKARHEPCSSCTHFRFPPVDSPLWHMIRGTHAEKKASLPEWMRRDVEPLGSPPECFGVCQEIVSPLTGLPAMCNGSRPACDLYKRSNWRAGLHVARDRRTSR